MRRILTGSLVCALACGSAEPATSPPTPSAAEDAGSAQQDAAPEATAAPAPVPDERFVPSLLRTFAGAAIDMASTPDGGFVVVGEFDETADYGLGPHTSVGLHDAFIVKLDASGNPVWHHTFGTPEAIDALARVVVDDQGVITALGGFGGPVDFGGGVVSTTPDAGATPRGVVYVQYDRDGHYLQSRAVEGLGADGLALAGARLLVAASRVPLPLAPLSLDTLDPKTGTLEAAGVSGDRGVFHSMEADARGALTAGEFEGTLRVAGVTLPIATESVGFAARVVDGRHAWARTWPRASRFRAALSSTGAIVAGDCVGCVATDIGTNTLLVASLDDSGKDIWTRGFGPPESVPIPYRGWATLSSLAHAASGDTWIGGTFGGTFGFGFGTVLHTAPPRESDIFFARLDASGKTVWSARAGGGGMISTVSKFVVDAHGDAFAVGTCAPGSEMSVAGGWYFLRLPR